MEEESKAHSEKEDKAPLIEQTKSQSKSNKETYEMPHDLLRCLLDLTNKTYIQNHDIEMLFKNVDNATSLEAKIYLLNALKDLVWLIPEKMYPQKDNREKYREVSPY